MQHPVCEILSLWPTRRAVLDDARELEPTLDIVVVHRWFQRGSVPSKFWGVLIEGAARRSLRVHAHDFVKAHDGRTDAAGPRLISENEEDAA